MPTINKKTEEDQVVKEFNEQYKKMWESVSTKSIRSKKSLSNKEFIREVEEFIASHK